MDKNYMVTKSNALIQAHYDLSVHEQKLILTLASLVQPDDQDFKEYEFKIKDFMSLIGVLNKNQYREAAKTTEGLMKKIFKIREGNILRQFAWLCSATYKFGEGTVILKFAPELKEYMLFLKEFYTTYRLENILSLKSKYSIRLYEILKCNAFRSPFVIDLDELKKMVGANAPYLKTYKDFKRKVLLHAQEEINQKTDINFDFFGIIDCRKIKSIRFVIKTKPDHQFADQINDYDIFNNDIQEPEDSLLNGINKKLGVKFNLKALKKLIAAKGIEKIQFYLDNWNKFDCTGKNNIAGFFYKAVIEEWEIPQQGNVKPVQATNYQQREYDDEHYDSLYANLFAKNNI